VVKGALRSVFRGGGSSHVALAEESVGVRGEGRGALALVDVEDDDRAGGWLGLALLRLPRTPGSSRSSAPCCSGGS